MAWLLSTFTWCFPLFLLGIVFFPISRKLFPDFIDQGYAFSKTIAILIISYITFILGLAKILPFSQESLFVLIGIFAVVTFVIQRRTSWPHALTKRVLFLIVFEEILFIISLIFLAFVRGQEPSIHGLEKFMDFGFMNSILRSQYFPPLDMWLSSDPSHPTGYPINYYYFGHLTGALLIKLAGVSPSVGYNLILATIFAQGITLVFSLTASIVGAIKKFSIWILIVYGLLGAFVTNLAGNLHTIYLFTSGYPNDTPKPFWEILSTYNPTKYWYPNATRFIPFTIHEFPSYSYVVADLHGHVFDIPFVLLTLALLFVFFMSVSAQQTHELRRGRHEKSERSHHSTFIILNSAIFGFMTAIHYMTNAFDGPIYMLLAVVIFLALFGMSRKFFMYSVSTAVFYILFSLPFSINFSPFVSGIGMNCSPAFLVAMKKIGPFLFEKGNCQPFVWWMFLVLWGFFLINFIIHLIARYASSKTLPSAVISAFIIILFIFGTFLVIIPEFFYIKDIYPAHFRANTMFKLGYQAFIIMSVASVVGLAFISSIKGWWKYILKCICCGIFFLISLYPFHSFQSYYGTFKKTPQLDGSLWLATQYPQDKEIIDYLNRHVIGQPTILEAQGDSYSDYARISAYTGLPTVAGWWVHEWLWRGSSDVVGKRIPDVTSLYESGDPIKTQELLQKYHIQYIVISKLERDKYKNIDESIFDSIGTRLFESSNKFGALYKAK